MSTTTRNIIENMGAMLDLQADRLTDDDHLIDSFDEGPFEAAMNRAIDYEDQVRAIREVHAKRHRVTA